MAVTAHYIFILRYLLWLTYTHIRQEFAPIFIILFMNIVDINGVISQTKVIFRNVCGYS